MSTENAMSYKDIILGEQQPIKIIKDPVALKLVKDYYFIIAYLREGPKTIDDIVLYAEKEEWPTTSDKTLYRYLNKLIEAGLVLIIGQRVIEGQRVNQNLFGRSAKVFLLYKDQEASKAACDMWCSPEGEVMIKKLIALLKLLSHIEVSSYDQVQNCLTTFFTKSDQQLNYLMNTAETDPHAISEIFDGLSIEEIGKLMDIYSLITVLASNEDLMKTIRQVFKVIQ